MTTCNWETVPSQVSGERERNQNLLSDHQVTADSFFFLFFACIGSLLLCAGFLKLWPAGATLHCGARASHRGGFSCCGARALGVQASVAVASGLSSCGTRAQLLCGMWDLPGPGIEPVSRALAGGRLSTALPGKSQILFILFNLIFTISLWTLCSNICVPVVQMRKLSLVEIM